MDEKKKKRKKRSSLFSTILLFLILVIGMSLLLYPTVSNWWNQFHQSRAIATYTEAVVAIDQEAYDRMLADAREYNEILAGTSNRLMPTDEMHELYESLLDVTGTGIMGYINIPKISVHLPIYHGVEDVVLQVAAGHIEGTSLPVGGEGTHTVISGHRGLPSARLFTDLDQLIEGDYVLLTILNETFTYEVDQIRIVLPAEVDSLTIEPGKDYCTLVTCTPYGINSHRMLIRGHRVENLEEEIQVSADAELFEPMQVAPLVAAPILLFLLFMLLLKPKKPKLKHVSDVELEMSREKNKTE